MKKQVFATGLFLLSAFLPASAVAQTEVYVFGDSLVDVGNLFEATQERLPPSPPYFEGRFSNGPLWIELLSAQLSLAADPANNFAIAGATSGNTNTLPLNDLSGLEQQIDTFISTEGTADPNGLYVVWAGANDYLGGGATDPTAVVNNLTTATAKLIAAGAQTIIVPNLSDLGKTPEGLSGSTSATLSELTAGHNSNLNAALQSLVQQNPQVNIIPLDVSALFNEIVADPARYGFTNVTDSCVTVPARSRTPVACATPDQYLFWDPIHPSAAANELLAEFTYAVLMGPQAVTPLGDLALNFAQSQTQDIENRLFALRTGLETSTEGWGVFVAGNVNFGSQDSTSTKPGFDFFDRGATVGLDYRLLDSWVLGFGLGYRTSNSDLLSQSGFIDTEGYAVSLYSSFAQNNFYADALVSYGWNTFDILRLISFDDRRATANPRGNQLSSRFNTGYNFTVGNFTVGPTVGLRYDDVDIDSYTEQGAGSLNMVVHRQRIESLLLSLGAQATYTLNTDFGTVMPYVRASFEHEFANDIRQVITELATQPGIPIKTPVNPLDRDFVRLGVGVQANVMNNLSGLFGYELILGRDTVTDQTFSAVIRYQF